ncbi:hypothetical protein NJBCHELONAE_21750 [Mycobacteroides chelonae]|nr:hypothetical protein NJBCHELONAE_21750 [Mycobacteroides chelonae]
MGVEPVGVELDAIDRNGPRVADAPFLVLQVTGPARREDHRVSGGETRGHLKSDFAASAEYHHRRRSSRTRIIPKLAGVSHRVGHVSDYVLR